MTKTAVVFPGQGSQFAGMGKDFYDKYAEVRKVFDKADEVLGYSLTSIMFNGPEEDLKLTSNTQPALLTMSIGIWEAVKNKIKADYFAGHSLGEYSALVAAGGISFEDAVLAVHNRGKFMQEAVPVGTGAMAAVMGADDAIIADVCKACSKPGSVVEPANFNCPGQTVVAGNAEAVNLFCEKIKEAGAKRAILLPVSAPFHCSLMKPAAEKMAAYLKNIKINDLQAPVFNNVNAEIETDAETVYNSLVKQVASPVLWTKSVENMAASGVNTIIEVGAGKVLTGLVKKINKEIEVRNIGTLGDEDGI
ncbi:[acyl-carrier-protein] S-malonyltransferase [Geovibrio thiophilus]|uniref:Malonyl CoA-acyl carrier protein transacylase n=1 Tax=Geovibrio thiophilus TaxID=139438 RepID=A0A3R5UZ74_9BACT|nr:ACP S-malonyltransferase [Geovibrio thiophilus]QAR31906.1 [acyl-carrier-protein] S-malonyltransferase [Geovibrio thiophilus]